MLFLLWRLFGRLLLRLALVALLFGGLRRLLAYRRRPFDPARPSHPWGTRDLTIDEPPPPPDR